MEKIVDIIESIANEKGLKIEDVKSTVSFAMNKTAKRIYGEEYEYETIIDEKKKTLHLFQKIMVVSDDDERLEDSKENFKTLKEARKENPEIEVGDELRYELPLENLGRTAAATLQRELEYHIQRLIENQIFEKYQNMIGKSVFGSVVRVDHEENTYIEIDEIKGILTRKNRIKGESFRVGNVVKSVIKSVTIDRAMGIKIELSRTSPRFLESLLTLEVPEIQDGLVIVNKSARIPGERAKVALTSTHPNIDAVGATVGVRGVRINSVSKELKNENIDCIEYSNIPEIFLARALSPAIISSVKMVGENKAVVTLQAEQKSKAIGKSGINIRLVSMLTGIEIELNEIGSVAPKGESSKSTAEALKDLKALFGD